MHYRSLAPNSRSIGSRPTLQTRRVRPREVTEPRPALQAARDTAGISFSARIPGRDGAGSRVGQGQGSHPGPGSRKHIPKLSAEGCRTNQETGRKGLVKAEREGGWNRGVVGGPVTGSGQKECVCSGGYSVGPGCPHPSHPTHRTDLPDRECL